MSLTRHCIRLVGKLKRANQVRSLYHLTNVQTSNVIERCRVPPMCLCQTPIVTEHVRNYAKGRDKVKHQGKKKGHHDSSVHLEDEEFAEFVDMAAYRDELEEIVEQFKKDLIHKMALRTNIGSYEKLEVKTKDGAFPLNQIASIAQKSPTLLVVSLSKHIGYMPDVIAALKTMNLNPQQEGQSAILVTMAKVSREHREEMAKKTKTLLNTTKDKLNKLFSKTSKLVPSDDWEFKKIADDQLLNEKKKAITTCEQLMKTKTDELLG